MEHQYAKLKNGLQLLLVPSNGAITHLGILINVGSRDETSAEHGLAHFIEHVIFKGTKKRKAYQILGRLENVGGEMNAYTSKEDTLIQASFLNCHLERAMELFSDILLNSSFPAAELEKEKDVIADEINYYLDLPDESIFDDFEAAIFKGMPLGRRITGTPETLRRFNRPTIQKFIRANYIAGNIILCVAGITPFNELKFFAEKYFGEFAKGNPVRKKKTLQSYIPSSIKISKEINQSHCLLGNRAFSHFDDRRLPMALLSNYLGGPGMNARLSMIVREKFGLAYNIESHFVSFADTGIFSVYLGADAQTMERAIGLVQREMSKLMKERMGVLQLQRAKLQAIGQMAISLEHPASRMLNAAKSYLIYNRTESFEGVCKRIEEIDSSDIMDIANLIFEPSKLSMVLYNTTTHDTRRNH